MFPVEEPTTQPEPLDETALQAAVAHAIDDAVDYCDFELSRLREKATNYYRGEKFGNEMEGRSQVVSRDVADVLGFMLPQLMAIFFGSETIAEFIPVGPEDVDFAEQATDYVKHIISEDNNGFLLFYETFKDALLRKTGITKTWWNTEETVQSYTYSGLDQATAMMLQQSEPTVVLTPQPDGTVSAKLTRKVPADRVAICSLPPEEFLVSRNAVDLGTADLVGHRSRMTTSDLIALGFTQDEIDEAGDDDTLSLNPERMARQVNQTVWTDSDLNPALQRHLYIEAYTRIDMTGTGIAELRRICCLGSAYKIVRNDPCDEQPFCVFCPDPEPHALIGGSVADQVMDLQLIKSQIMRLTLDSLSLSIVPRYGVVDQQANMEDVLNTALGAPIRMKAPNMVQPFTVPFVGQAAFPVLAYMDEVRENRTGVSKASQGLAADALQSSTKAAVTATVTAAQRKIELTARIFAETGLKPLFKSILRLIVKYQDKPRTIRLRNRFVPMDPRVWNTSMDVTVNVGLGGGTTEDRLTTLSQIAQKQEQILQTLGPSNPLVSLSQYSTTLRKMTELAGFKDSSLFFSQVPANWQPPQQSQQPPPSPQEQAALILAQAQQREIAANIQIKNQEMALKAATAKMEDDREREKQASDERVKLAEIQAKYNSNMAGVQADIDHRLAQIRLQEQQQQFEQSQPAQQPPAQAQEQPTQ